MGHTRKSKAPWEADLRTGAKDRKEHRSAAVELDAEFVASSSEAGVGVAAIPRGSGGQSHLRAAGMEKGRSFYGRARKVSFMVLMTAIVLILGESMSIFMSRNYAFPRLRALLSTLDNGVWNPLHSQRDESAQTRSDAESLNLEPQGTLEQCQSYSSEVEWVRFPIIADESEHILAHLKFNETSERCQRVDTQRILITGLPNPKPGESLRLIAGPVYDLTILALGPDWRRRCGGGDFYETDLSGTFWKSRPPVVDMDDGSYQVQLQVDARFAGHYVLKVVLLFTNYGGLILLPNPGSKSGRGGRNVLVAQMDIEFVLPPQPNPPLELGRCTGDDDYKLKRWSGRWTREQFNESCSMDASGRWLCLDPDTPCEEPWCQGPVARLESNGWVYSAHCSFRIFTKQEAWKCLDGKWIFWWGDSNHYGTARNLLHLVLGFHENIHPHTVFRGQDHVWVLDPTEHSHAQQHREKGSRISKRVRQHSTGGPAAQQQPSEPPTQKPRILRMTNEFNGGPATKINFKGLSSIDTPSYRDRLRGFFQEEKKPDFIVMNSGLHDGHFWPNAESFLKHGVKDNVQFWTEIFERIQPETPRIIYRTTVAAAAEDRLGNMNPMKMELFNRLFVDRLSEANWTNFRLIDGYDLTFPWHYDFCCSDGVHYGIMPANEKFYGGRTGHQYFVDLMLVHMLLNAMCLE